MSFPTGFKVTEVGVIPQDWRVATLQTCCDILTGYPFQSSKFVDSGIRLIRGSNVKRDEIDWSDEIAQYWPDAARGMARYLLREGDIVIAMDGALVGRSFAEISSKYLPALLVQRVARLRSDGCNQRYVSFWVRSDKFSRHCDDFKTNTAIPHISPSDIKTFLIALPSDEQEQSAIAEALSDMDEAIATVKAVIAKKRALKIATMQALLSGTRRLPGFGESAESKRMKRCEAGVIPEDWKVISLSQTAKRITRGASPRPIDSPVWFDDNSSVGWVRISDVTRSGRHLTETTQRLSEAGIRRSRPVPPGSLIMSICATVGRPIETRIATCIHDGFVVFDQPSVDQSFLYHRLVALEPTWAKHGQTGSQMNLNTGLIKACLISVPPTKAEQSAIAEVLSDMDEDISVQESKLTKLRGLKTGMMQQLLTGKIRLA